MQSEHHRVYPRAMKMINVGGKLAKNYKLDNGLHTSPTHTLTYIHRHSYCVLVQSKKKFSCVLLREISYTRITSSVFSDAERYANLFDCQLYLKFIRDSRLIYFLQCFFSSHKETSRFDLSQKCNQPAQFLNSKILVSRNLRLLFIVVDYTPDAWAARS